MDSTSFANVSQLKGVILSLHFFARVFSFFSFSFPLKECWKWCNVSSFLLSDNHYYTVVSIVTHSTTPFNMEHYLQHMVRLHICLMCCGADLYILFLGPSTMGHLNMFWALRWQQNAWFDTCWMFKTLPLVHVKRDIMMDTFNKPTWMNSNQFFVKMLRTTTLHVWY
jgi:hypothetical protein